jgi:hypothetical protein
VTELLWWWLGLAAKHIIGLSKPQIHEDYHFTHLETNQIWNKEGNPKQKKAVSNQVSLPA